MTDRVIASGRWLRLVDRDGWEFTDRAIGSGVVCVVAVTDAGEIVLVEQHRPPLGRTAIELPAGVAGDLAEHSDESQMDAARRELLEETGYRATAMEAGPRLCSSGGMTSEEIDVFIARGIERVGPGGGDDSEDITVHCVPLETAGSWLAEQQRRGCAIDGRVYAALWLAAHDHRGA